ncbi:MAG: hypothetical protein PHU49_15440, partial [Syntrophorhabdaceae bacterium]|nr:hypothetical protein [Syntrophorhabdaceae bacterium]
TISTPRYSMIDHRYSKLTADRLKNDSSSSLLQIPVKIFVNTQSKQIQGIVTMLISQQIKLILNTKLVNTDACKVAFFFFSTRRLRCYPLYCLVNNCQLISV